MPIESINGLRHYFRLEGSPERPPLVLVHPIGADHSLWDKVVPLLTQQWRILRYDIRGHGGTQSPARDTTVEDLAADLLQLTDHLGWSRFSLCGLSVGGMAAMHVAASAPDRVAGLVLCSTAARMVAPPGGWDQRQQVAREQGMAPLAGPMVERMFSTPFREASDPHLETMRTVFLKTDPMGYASCVAVLRDADLRPALANIRAKALIVHGSADPLVPATAVEELLGGISGGRQLTLDSGHFPPIEAPNAFADEMSAFLRS